MSGYTTLLHKYPSKPWYLVLPVNILMTRNIHTYIHTNIHTYIHVIYTSQYFGISRFNQNYHVDNFIQYHGNLVSHFVSSFTTALTLDIHCYWSEKPYF